VLDRLCGNALDIGERLGSLTDEKRERRLVVQTTRGGEATRRPRLGRTRRRKTPCKGDELELYKNQGK